MLDVNLDKLRGLLVERHVKLEALAKAIGQSRSTLYRRMEKGGGDFTTEEIFKMKDYIPLTD